MPRELNLENSAIIEAIKAGSEKILFQLYEAYRDEFVNWAVRNHKVSVEEAKDIFQEAMVGLYKNVKGGRVDSLTVTVKTYLFGIGKNNLLNLIKRKSIEQKVMAEFEAVPEYGIAKRYDEEHMVYLAKRIYRAIGSPCKEVLEMFYANGYDMESIALRLGYKNSDVAKKKKYECLKKLEERISVSELMKYQ